MRSRSIVDAGDTQMLIALVNRIKFRFPSRRCWWILICVDEETRKTSIGAARFGFAQRVRL